MRDKRLVKRIPVRLYDIELVKVLEEWVKLKGSHKASELIERLLTEYFFGGGDD